MGSNCTFLYIVLDIIYCIKCKANVVNDKEYAIIFFFRKIYFIYMVVVTTIWTEIQNFHYAWVVKLLEALLYIHWRGNKSKTKLYTLCVHALHLSIWQMKGLRLHFNVKRQYSNTRYIYIYIYIYNDNWNTDHCNSIILKQT